MARFYGKVGFIGETTETSPGIWEELLEARPYYGDVVRNVRRTDGGSQVNATVSVANQISVVADAFAFDHIHAIRYVVWGSTAWEVTSVEVEHPRLVLTLGGVYTGNKA